VGDCQIVKLEIRVERTMLVISDSNEPMIAEGIMKAMGRNMSPR
jgi:hypothetical protein